MVCPAKPHSFECVRPQLPEGLGGVHPRQADAGLSSLLQAEETDGHALGVLIYNLPFEPWLRGHPMATSSQDLIEAQVTGSAFVMGCAWGRGGDLWLGLCPQ